MRDTVFILLIVAVLLGFLGGLIYDIVVLQPERQADYVRRTRLVESSILDIEFDIRNGIVKLEKPDDIVQSLRQCVSILKSTYAVPLEK